MDDPIKLPSTVPNVYSMHTALLQISHHANAWAVAMLRHADPAPADVCLWWTCVVGSRTMVSERAVVVTPL